MHKAPVTSPMDRLNEHVAIVSERLGAPTHVTLGAGCVIVLGMLFLILALFRSTFQSASARPPAKRAPLPAFAFDVEGGSSAANGSGAKVLHPTIARAAADSDIATLRSWLADDRCAVDAALAVDGSTALHHAAKAGHANVVRLLLEGGADCLAVDSELHTPLHHVAAKGHGLCVKALLDAGADPEAKDQRGASPLSMAEAGKHMGTARMMRLHMERGRAEGHAHLRRAK